MRNERTTGRALRTSTKWLDASTCVPVCAQNPSSIDSLQMSPRACTSAPGLGRELASSLSGDTCAGARACLGLAERADAAQAGVTAHHHAARVQAHRYVDDALPALPAGAAGVAADVTALISGRSPSALPRHSSGTAPVLRRPRRRMRGQARPPPAHSEAQGRRCIGLLYAPSTRLAPGCPCA